MIPTKKTTEFWINEFRKSIALLKAKYANREPSELELLEVKALESQLQTLEAENLDKV